jgi:hypothetical protein
LVGLVRRGGNKSGCRRRGELGRLCCMEAGEIAAYVAAAVALIVGLVNPLLASRSQSKQRLEERAKRGREEVVTLVEDAAIALGRGRRKMEGIHQLWRLGVSPDSDLAHREFTEPDTAVEEARAAYSRLLLRFSEDDPLPTAYREATENFDAYMRLLRAYNSGDPYGEAAGEVDFARGFAIVAEGKFLGGQVP